MPLPSEFEATLESITSIVDNVEHVRGERFTRILLLALSIESICKVVCMGPNRELVLRMLGDTFCGFLDVLDVSDADRAELANIVKTVDSQARSLGRRNGSA